MQLIVKDAFRLPTLLAIGALAQMIIFAVFPARYASIPVTLVLVRSIVTTIIQIRSPKDNAFTTDTVYGRVTAQLPSRATGEFGSKPAAESLVVFHLGVRNNHPLGVLAPGAREIGEHFQAMTKVLGQRRDEIGMLGMSAWQANERETNNHLLTILYFRDFEGLNKFAHDKVHREGWDWYRDFAVKAGNKHIAIYHETFVTSPGQYETIYVDSAPVLLGAANLRVRMGDGKQQPREETWARTLVSAKHSALKSQSKRIGTTLGVEGDEEMY